MADDTQGIGGDGAIHEFVIVGVGEQIEAVGGTDEAGVNSGENQFQRLFAKCSSHVAADNFRVFRQYLVGYTKRKLAQQKAFV